MDRSYEWLFGYCIACAKTPCVLLRTPRSLLLWIHDFPQFWKAKPIQCLIQYPIQYHPSWMDGRPAMTERKHNFFMEKSIYMIDPFIWSIHLYDQIWANIIIFQKIWSRNHVCWLFIIIYDSFWEYDVKQKKHAPARNAPAGRGPRQSLEENKSSNNPIQ